MRSDNTIEAAMGAVNMPPRIFLYTLDQISYMLEIPIRTLRLSYIYFQGVSTGPRNRHMMLARDTSVPGGDSVRDWRVAETELTRWMKLKGFRFTRGGRVLD